MGLTAVVPGGSRLATDKMALHNFHRHFSLFLARVALGCAVLPVAFAQVVPEVDAGESNPAPLILRDTAPVGLKAAVVETLDVDGSGASHGTSDGLLVLRYLYGLRGSALIQGAVGSGATRKTAPDIQTYLAGLTSGSPPALDIDGNLTADALTDGLLVFRYLLGERGAALIAGAIGAGASRTTFTPIETYLATLTAATPHPPSGCSINASPASSSGAPLAPGTPVQLTASCTAGEPPITFIWDGGAFTGSVRNVAPAATTTYSVVASNYAGSAAAVNTTVFVGVTSYCQAGDHITVVPWPPSGQVQLGTTAFVNQVYSFQVTIPFTFSPPLDITHTGAVNTGEVPGRPPTFRELTVSKSACDFHAPHGGYMFDTIGDPDTGPFFSFTVNNPGSTAAVNFQSGDVIYINFRNSFLSNGTETPSCTDPTVFCDMLFDFATPNRN